MNNKVSALSANKQEFHEKGHSSLDVAMLGPVTNLEYSWLGVNPEGVAHDTGCTDPNGLLDIKFPYNCPESTHFIQHPKKFFVVGLKWVCLFLENNLIVIIKCKDKWLPTIESCATLWFLQMLRILPADFFFNESFWTFMASKLKCFIPHLLCLACKHIVIFFIDMFMTTDI